jgi:hypothetical protein
MSFRWSSAVWTLACAMAIAPPATAGLRARLRGSQSRHSSGVSTRKRLHINDLIAEPGTVELDWGGLYSYTTGASTMPSAIKYTPAGRSIVWGQTEYSVAFDSVSSAISAGGRATQFSDRLTFAATSVVYDSCHFDLAVAPQITALLRSDSGARAGGTAIARFAAGGNDFGFTAGWSGATSATDTNPAGVWDFGGGFGRPLRSKGVLNRLTPHVNAILEKSTGFERTLAGFAGIEYQVTKRLAVDVSGQRFGLSGGEPDRQVLVGLTLNLGKRN